MTTTLDDHDCVARGCGTGADDVSPAGVPAEVLEAAARLIAAWLREDESNLTLGDVRSGFRLREQIADEIERVFG